MHKYGLIGRNISYSFSRGYFAEKFQKLKIEASYENFDLQEIEAFPKVIKSTEDLRGLNVTIPYKEEVIQFLDELDPVAREIRAVNTIKILKNGKLKGYNTDHFGFTESLKPYLKHRHKKALILGTGGASKAVAYGLKALGLEYSFLSRTATDTILSYDDCSEAIIKDHQIIINCTPLGTSPRTEEFPPIPVEGITEDHLIFDLIYNPAETMLMKVGAQKGATTINGLRMLELQAEKAWEIWNK